VGRFCYLILIGLVSSGSTHLVGWFGSVFLLTSSIRSDSVSNLFHPSLRAAGLVRCGSRRFPAAGVAPLVAAGCGRGARAPPVAGAEGLVRRQGIPLVLLQLRSSIRILFCCKTGRGRRGWPSTMSRSRTRRSTRSSTR